MSLDIDRLKGIVATAVEMRPPKFEAGTAPSVKVSALEDYLLASAYMHAELEEVLHWLDALTAHFKAKVEQMTGWEALLPNKRRERITQNDIVAAKRRSDPVIFEAGAEANHLRATTMRQIARFEFEKDVISLADRLISGRR